jgi:ubiquinone/menaquinone biosynthesis C-methylase UbiE
MLGNLVNRHDLVSLFEKARYGGLAPMLRRLAGRRSQRVRAAWADAGYSNSQWWAIWSVQRRWRTKVCGTPELAFPDYVRTRHLGAASDLTGLAPGCGSGFHVLRWAELGIFRRLDAFDVSPERIEAARAEAERRGLDAIVRFTVADVATIEFPDGAYDVVLGEHALHHFTPLDAVLDRLARCLKPDGMLYVDEYVGPTRHQWTARQLTAANALLAMLPARYRRTEAGRTKRVVIRPSILRMLLTDPSEAVESDRLLPLLHQRFRVVEEHGYGGTLLELVFAGIAQNFLGDDDETRRWLDLCFATEDALLAAGEIPHSFVVAVCRQRTA